MPKHNKPLGKDRKTTRHNGQENLGAAVISFVPDVPESKNGKPSGYAVVNNVAVTASTNNEDAINGKSIYPSNGGGRNGKGKRGWVDCPNSQPSSNGEAKVSSREPTDEEYRAAFGEEYVDYLKEVKAEQFEAELFDLSKLRLSALPVHDSFDLGIDKFVKKNPELVMPPIDNSTDDLNLTMLPNTKAEQEDMALCDLSGFGFSDPLPQPDLSDPGQLEKTIRKLDNKPPQILAQNKEHKTVFSTKPQQQAETPRAKGRFKRALLRTAAQSALSMAAGYGTKVLLTKFALASLAVTFPVATPLVVLGLSAATSATLVSGLTGGKQLGKTAAISAAIGVITGGVSTHLFPLISNTGFSQRITASITGGIAGATAASAGMLMTEQGRKLSLTKRFGKMALGFATGAIAGLVGASLAEMNAQGGHGQTHNYAANQPAADQQHHTSVAKHEIPKPVVDTAPENNQQLAATATKTVETIKLAPANATPITSIGQGYNGTNHFAPAVSGNDVGVGHAHVNTPNNNALTVDHGGATADHQAQTAKAQSQHHEVKAETATEPLKTVEKPDTTQHAAQSQQQQDNPVVKAFKKAANAVRKHVWKPYVGPKTGKVYNHDNYLPESLRKMGYYLVRRGKVFQVCAP